MNIIEIIEKKRDNKALNENEITYFVNAYVAGEIQDYQASALLMAICINNMNDEETFYLCKAMLESGEQINLSSVHGVCVDKHSTGGVGDKTSLVLAPMLAACGLKVAKMSGRGLSHTGGALDKLEAIENFNISLNQNQFIKQVNEIGLAIIGQNANLVPADKKLYALRDVCGCVPSIPLIASSIMSKKIAAGADYILLDVKYGDGAFMETKEDAELLARKMITIAKPFHKTIKAEITSMQQPLGNAIGNSLEVIEAIKTLQNQGPDDFRTLCVKSCSTLLCMSGKCNNEEEAITLSNKVLEDGNALTCFINMCKWQGANLQQITDFNKFKKSKYQFVCKADKLVFVNAIQAKQLGLLACELGAGRKTKDDTIQHEVGIVLNKKCGDFVCEEETLCYIYANETLLPSFMDKIADCFTIDSVAKESEPLLYKTI